MLTDFEKKIHHAHFLISYVLSTFYSSFIAVMYKFFSKRSHPPRLFQPPIRKMRVHIWLEKKNIIMRFKNKGSVINPNAILIYDFFSIIWYCVCKILNLIFPAHKARTNLQLPLRQWGARNVYLLVLSSWKVNIAEKGALLSLQPLTSNLIFLY